MAKRRKKKKSGFKSKLGLLLFLAALLFIAYIILSNRNNAGSGKGELYELSLELAIPQLAPEVKSQVIEHLGYTVSYNSRHKNPNWVAYELTAEELQGKESRNGSFIPDPLASGDQASTKDYTRSGWDRGHLAPAADMAWSKEAMRESFYLSNISPQAPGLNRGKWKSLEDFTRDNARRYGKLLVVTGPVFKEGDGMGCIGKNKVTVPDAFYKVLLMNDNGLSGIGFYFDNTDSKNRLQSHAISIDSVESITGIDFFYKLPDNIEEQVERSYSWEKWSTVSTRKEK